MGLELKLDLDEGRELELDLDEGHDAPPPPPCGVVTRSSLQQETSALSEDIIRVIASGNWERLLPNSGNSVEVGGHQVCVSCDVESSAEYRTWEWQGHILVYDEEEMYVPEYVYGNHFEPVLKTESLYENFLERPPYGLTGIISNIERRLNESS